MLNLRNILKRKKKPHPDSVVLEQFIQQLYWGQALSAKEATARAEDSIIEIVESGRHSSNGILITQDGYFLTAARCLEGGLSSMNINTKTNRRCPIERVCLVDEQADVALAKAAVAGSKEPQRYKVYSTTDVELLCKQPIMLLTRQDGQLMRQFGVVERSWSCLYTKSNGAVRNITGHFAARIDTRAGDSGGSILTAQGALLGLHCARSEYQSCTEIKILHALEIVHAYTRQLEAAL